MNNKLGFVFLACLINVVACTQSNLEVEHFNDDNAGEYALASAQLKSMQLDLNGDGLCSSNLLDELTLKGSGNGNLGRISSIYGQAGSIQKADYPDMPYKIVLAFPMQHVDKYVKTQEVTMRDADHRDFIFEYVISQDGSYKINLTPKADWSIFPQPYMAGGTQWDFNYLNYTGPQVYNIDIDNGWIKATVDLPFYDFATDKCFILPVRLEYKRVAWPK